MYIAREKLSIEHSEAAEIRASSAKGTCTLPDGINKKESHYAEAKLGELLSKIEPKYVGSIKGTHVPQQLKTLPDGIDKKESHYAQQI